MSPASAPSPDIDCDILVAGGGLVGAALAAALRDTGFRIMVVEAVPFRAAGQPSFDERSTAISFGSRRILDTMGVWEGMEAAACPIHKVHVSQQRRLGITRLSAEEENQPALGYVVPNRVVGAALMKAIQDHPAIELRAPASVSDIAFHDTHAEVTLQEDGKDRVVRSRIVVVADGAHSALRDKLEVSARKWPYSQAAIVCNIAAERPHQHVAYERFTPAGPLALLPLDAERMTLVLVENEDVVDEVLALDDAAFLARVQQRFGKRLGRFTQVGQRASYPLSLITAGEQVRERAVILGNAAHSLHPIAGQGFNLSLRDVATLADVLVDQRDALGSREHANAALRAYVDWRRADQRKVVTFTDVLNRLFMLPFSAAAHARGLGLLGLDLLPGLRTEFARHAMGKAGKLPRLARGLKL